MDQDQTNAPPGWIEALARSDAELASGRLVSAQSVHDGLRAVLARMEAELAEDKKAPEPSVHRR